MSCWTIILLDWNYLYNFLWLLTLIVIWEHDLDFFPPTASDSWLILSSQQGIDSNFCLIWLLNWVCCTSLNVSFRVISEGMRGIGRTGETHKDGDDECLSPVMSNSGAHWETQVGSKLPTLFWGFPLVISWQTLSFSFYLFCSLLK